MDLIGGIKKVDHRPGGRKPNHGEGKLLQKNTPNHAVGEKHALADADRSATQFDTPLGRKVDTTA